MKNSKIKQDLFSRFVNWFSQYGRDKEPIDKAEGNTDFFSRLMNNISD